MVAGKDGSSTLAALCGEYNLDLVILYGSQVNHCTHAKSDTDVGILGKEGLIPTDRYLDIYGDLSEIFPAANLDLVDLSRVPGLLKHIACERGVLLYESAPGLFARFRILAWNLYQDERIRIRRHDTDAIQASLRSLT